VVEGERRRERFVVFLRTHAGTRRGGRVRAGVHVEVGVLFDHVRRERGRRLLDNCGHVGIAVKWGCWTAPQGTGAREGSACRCDGLLARCNVQFAVLLNALNRSACGSAAVIPVGRPRRRRVDLFLSGLEGRAHSRWRAR
jgi:hypothetical protein